MNDTESEVRVQVGNINKQLWLVLASATGPFLILAVAGVLTEESQENKLLIASLFLFSFGLALITTKVASHTAIGRHLDNIEKINELKSDFISIASHQLKTPVSAFTYSLDGLNSAYTKGDTQAVEEFLHDMKNSANRLSLLTKNLLNVALINDEAQAATMDTFAIRPEVMGIIDHLEPFRASQAVELVSDVNITDDTTAYCDRVRFYHVLENLLTNALKYTESAQPVKVRVEDEKEVVSFFITNKTSTLKRTDLGNLFQKFKRGGSVHTTKSQGFGLGLYIAKTFIESWGGTITVNMDDATQEVTFHFTVLKSSAAKPVTTHHQETF